MLDLGTIQPGTTLYIPFHTFDSNDPSASVTLTGLAATDIEIYKDGSVTQRASDAGYALLDTDGIDFDAITGIHGISVDLADNTTAGFYAAGSQYWVVISSVTVDAATINFIAATFRIGYPGARLNTTIATLASQTSFTLTSGPAEDDALNGQWCVIHDVASAVQCGHAIISDYTGATKTVTLAAGTTFTAAAGDNISIMGPSPVQPTVAGRTLDVSAGGEAGVDWANVGTPGSTVSLSATTVATVTTAATATNLTNLPSIPANWVTTAGITDGAFTAAKFAASSLNGKGDWNVGKTGYSLTQTFPANFADLSITVTTGRVTVGTNADKTGYSLTVTTGLGNQTADITGSLSGSVGSVTGAVGSVTGAVGSVTAGVTVTTNNDKTGYALTATTGLGNQTANITGNLSGSVGSVTGAVGSVTGAVGSVAAGGITASSIATAAIDADALATDAVNEIADAWLDRNMATGTDSGSPTVRTPRQALRASRNKVAVAAGTATIYKEDDTTASWTAAVATAAGNPISEVDPASA